jgi:hypothetical protein
MNLLYWMNDFSINAVSDKFSNFVMHIFKNINASVLQNM